MLASIVWSYSYLWKTKRNLQQTKEKKRKKERKKENANKINVGYLV